MQNIVPPVDNSKHRHHKFADIPFCRAMRVLPSIILSVWILLSLDSCRNADHPIVKQAGHPATAIPANSDTAKRRIVFFGNSITAGYGLNPAEAFPALIQLRIDSLKLPYTVINAGVSGETSADGLSRIDWVLREPCYLFILELGGNDALRGLPLTETFRNLDSIVQKLRAKYPACKVILAGMQVPPSIGKDYTERFKKLFPELAKKDNLILIPFLLEGVGGIPSLNQPDGIHPTAEGDRMVAENVWRVLADLLLKSH
jgi:acyl-CoA thioesterase-1